jgi:hypothetical protein
VCAEVNLSFDVEIYFKALPNEFAAKWQAALQELGLKETVLVPPDWQTGGSWTLLEKPTDAPDADDSFAIYVSRVDAVQLAERDRTADEVALLSPAQYRADVSTRLSAGSFALMVAGSIAKITDGVIWDPQRAAAEPLFAADLAPYLPPTSADEKYTLAERGFYDARLAWAVAKAACAYEQRVAAQPSEAHAPSPQPVEAAPPTWAEQAKSPTTIVVGLLILCWVVYKLHKAGYF